MSDTAVKPVNQKIRFWIVRLAFLACVPLIVLARPIWADWALATAVLRSLGTLMLVAGVLYRVWAILYIGGRKNAEVVQDGPYSMSRHPLYFGTTLAMVGFGLMLQSLVFAALLGGLALLILSATAAREERFLRAEFGAGYETFARRVTTRVLPRVDLFHTADVVSFKPRILRTNIADALGFLVIIPLVALLDLLHAWGLPTLFSIF